MGCMCGRFAQGASLGLIERTLRVEAIHNHVAESLPRYNVAPSQPVTTLRLTKGGERELVSLIWGLIPHWAKDLSTMHAPINARIESAAERPTFRESFHHRRAIVPVMGFYEWQVKPGHKQPYFIRPQEDEDLLLLAGLWDRWQDRDTLAILTTDAQEVMKPIHERQPVLVALDDVDQWLREGDPGSGVPDLKAVPVSEKVNSPRNDGPELIEAIANGKAE